MNGKWIGLGMMVVSAWVLGWAVGREFEAASVEVRFEPDSRATEGCAEMAQRLINEAGRGDVVRVRAYGFSHPAIIAALVQAKGRDADVRLLLDRSNRGKEPALDAQRSGLDVRIDARHAIAHAKELVVGDAVFAGSFNFTISADERNAEGCTAIRSRRVAAEYLAEWDRHAAHAEEL